MNKTLNTRIQSAYMTEAQWQRINPVLLAGEVVYSSDNNKYKIGDGLKTWSQLEYISPEGITIVDTVESGNTNPISSGGVYSALHLTRADSSNYAYFNFSNESEDANGYNNNIVAPLKNMAYLLLDNPESLWEVGLYSESNDSSTIWGVGKRGRKITMGKPNEIYDMFTDGYEQHTAVEFAAGGTKGTNANVEIRIASLYKNHNNNTWAGGYLYFCYSESTNYVTGEYSLTTNNGVVYDGVSVSMLNNEQWNSFKANGCQDAINRMGLEWGDITIAKII